MKREIDWLEADRSPKGSAQRLQMIELLIYDQISFGHFKYPIAADLMKRWMSGQGDTTVKFGILLGNREFADAYGQLHSQLLLRCCKSTHDSEDWSNGRFTKGDLHLAFGWWGHFGGVSDTTQVGEECLTDRGQRGRLMRTTLGFSFSDRYNWHPGIVTPPFYVPHTSIGLGKVREDWYLEYKYFANLQGRKNVFGGPPQTFMTYSRRHEIWEVCCIGDSPGKFGLKRYWDDPQ